MLFTLKRPTSKRFVHLSFKGFGPSGRNKIEKHCKLWLEYIQLLFWYLLKKIKLVFLLFYQLGVFINNYILLAKAYLVRKLIWSRGKLGRRVATLIVLNVAFVVFMVGKVFNSSKLVNSQTINPDYLANVTDIIPQRNTALTTIPEERQRSEPFSYTVQVGDTLSDIGSKFKVSTDALRYVNNISDTSYLKVGQIIVVPPVIGLVHKIAKGDTLSSIANKYDVPSQAIADFNYILDTSSLAIGTDLIIPGASVPQPVAPAISAYIPSILSLPRSDPNASRSLCVWPTNVRIITQYFSWYHNGLDIASPTGANMPPIYSCTEGVVTRAGWDPWGLGLHIRIKHANGYETIYGHLSRLYVSVGQEIGRGDIIGVMGSTGHSTGPHVHFIVKYNGTPQNPFNYTN